MPTPDTVPAFELPTSTGQTLSRDSFLGKVAVVLFFIPDIGRPDYELRIQEYNGLLAEFGQAGCQVLGAARETAPSLREFADVFDIKLPILADASGRLARLCGAVDTEGHVQWVSLIADIDGKIRDRRDHQASAARHAAHTVLERVKDLVSDSPSERVTSVFDIPGRPSLPTSQALS
jgi:peroxiredoxin